jgi:hypothetical protein
VQLFESNRRECSKYLLGLHNNFETGIFATQTSEGGDRGSEDQKESMTEQTDGWVLSEIVLEVSHSQNIIDQERVVLISYVNSMSLGKCFDYHPLL